MMLGSLFYNNITLADRAREPTEPEPKTIILVQNHTVTYTGKDYMNFATANISEYAYVSIFVAWSCDIGVTLYIEPSCLNITSGDSTNFDGKITLYNPSGIWGQTVLVGFTVGSPNLNFKIYREDSANVELTIVLYCYN